MLKKNMKTLGEVGILISATRYRQLEAMSENNGKQYVAFQKRFIPKNTSYSVSKMTDIDHDAYFFSPNEKFDIYYILFTLNSYIGLEMVKGGPDSKKNVVTLSTLEKVPVMDIDMSYQNACGYMEQIIETLASIKNSETDRYLDYKKQTFEELRDAIITELMADDILPLKDIDLLESWYRMFKKYPHEKLMNSLEIVAYEMFDDLMSPRNQVMNNLKKFRISVRKYAALHSKY